MMRRTPAAQFSARSQMLIEKMNAFYLRNFDKEVVFDLSQKVTPRKERHWHGKLAPAMTGRIRKWRYKLTDTPYHKSEDGQGSDIMTRHAKPKKFWIEPHADFFLDQDLPGGQRDFSLAWTRFYTELERAAYIEPEQVLTLLHDLTLEGWTVPKEAYERADAFLLRSRERRARGIKPPITLQEVQGKERWPGENPVWDEEWDPVLPFTYYSQANPAYTYKPILESDWVHDPAPERHGELPPPETTRWEDWMMLSHQRQQVLLQQRTDERFAELLEGQNRDLWIKAHDEENPYAGGNDKVTRVRDADGRELVDRNGVPLLGHSDINHFIDEFFYNDTADALFFWKYTSDHLRLRHFVFEKTGKTLLEYTEPERFAILHACLDIRKAMLFDGDRIGQVIGSCITDEDYVEAFGEEEYRKFLRMEQRVVDEERRKFLRLWSTELSREERLDQVVEITKMRQEDEYHTGVYGGVARVKDRLDRKKWAVKEPSRQVQEYEAEVHASKEQRRKLFDDEMSALREEAQRCYGDEMYGTMERRINPNSRIKDVPDE